MTNNQGILGEADFQIISEEELLKIKQSENNKTNNGENEENNDEENITNILKETGIYDELDDEIKEKLGNI